MLEDEDKVLEDEDKVDTEEDEEDKDEGEGKDEDIGRDAKAAAVSVEEGMGGSEIGGS